MQPSKAQKRLKFAAVILLFCGIVGIFQAVGFGLFLVAHARHFSAVTGDEHVQALISYLLMAVEALVIGVIPGLSIIMLVAGFRVLAFLKKEPGESENEKL